MFHFYTLILLLQALALDAAIIHTGFSYGAFWSNGTAKTKTDFLKHFNLAKGLTDAPVTFSSARLFTSKQWQTKDTPTEAFDAAIETDTTLVLGIWASAFDDEWAALDSAFEKHGQKLADLVVGISVGNEDIYRNSGWCNEPDGSPCKDGQSAHIIMGMVEETRRRFSQAPWAKLFKPPPPIGHTDIAQFSPLEKLDFVGTTIYPYWNKEVIGNANKSFFSSLKDVQDRSNSTPVWVMETGWPFSGPAQGAAITSMGSMREYWKTVGCSIFGKYNVWWFQLEKDSIDGPGWGIIDPVSGEPRFDLSCPELSNVGSPANSSHILPITSAYTPSAFKILPSISPLSQQPSASRASPALLSMTASGGLPGFSFPKPKSGSPSLATTASLSTVQSTKAVTITEPSGCITVGDIQGNGSVVPIATNPPGPDGKCSSPPAITHLASSLFVPFNATSTATPLNTKWITVKECVTVYWVPSVSKYIAIATNPAGPGGTCPPVAPAASPLFSNHPNASPTSQVLVASSIVPFQPPLRATSVNVQPTPRLPWMSYSSTSTSEKVVYSTETMAS